jgi:hypothetical protein
MKYNLFTAWRSRSGEGENICRVKFVGASSARAACQLPNALIAAVVVFGAGVAARANDQVQIDVRGAIEKECAISGGSGVSSGFDHLDLTREGFREVNYTINCNTPFKYQIASQYGAMQNQDTFGRSNSTLGRIYYNINVYIPTDDITIDDHCPSEAIRIGQATCRLTDSRRGIAIDRQARVTVNWPRHAFLPAGEYSDRLTLSVAVRP